MQKLQGRFGASSRYGKRIREQVLIAERSSKQRKPCPSCSRSAVRRQASGIWSCGHCSAKYASGAYDFKV